MNNEYKTEIVKIRLSTPIQARTRCIKCGSVPNQYYRVYNGMTGYEPSRPKVRKFYKGYLSSRTGPRSVNKIATHFSYEPYHKRYTPTYHRVRASEPGAEFEFDLVEYVTCKCGSTTWAFREKTAVYRPEIINRKARNFFPVEMEY